MGEDAPQVLMDLPMFMLAPLSMTYAEYQLWRNSIPYAKWVLDELEYEEFNNTRFMPSLTPAVCALFLLIYFHFSFALLHMMMFKWDTYIRLALLLVLLSTLLIFLGQSMSIILMVSLMSLRWAATQMSWATLF